MRIRFKTRTLLVLTALLTLPSLHYGLFVKQHRDEEKALSALQDSGWAYSKLSEPVEYSKNEFANRTMQIINWPVGFVFGDEYLQRTYSIDLFPPNETVSSLGPLAKLKRLKLVTFDSSTGEQHVDHYVDTLLDVDRLECVSLFIDQINVESHKRLTAAGISVHHYGIREYELQRNCHFDGGRFFPVDVEKSSFGVSLIAGEPGLRLSLDIVTYDPMPQFEMPEPSFHTESFKTVGQLDEIIGSGKVFKIKGEFNDGSNYYNGIHQGLFNSTIELISRNGMNVHVKSHFKIDQEDAFVDVELPITSVAVFLDPNTIQGKSTQEKEQMAVLLLSTHFDTETFSEPVFAEAKSWIDERYVFTASGRCIRHDGLRHEQHWIPLTTDPSAFRCAVPFLNPRKLPPGYGGGTMIGLGLKKCQEVLVTRETGDRMIILVSDGVSADLGDGEEEVVAKSLRQDNIVVYSIHIGNGVTPPEVAAITNIANGKSFNPQDVQSLEGVFKRIDSMEVAEMKQTYAEILDWFSPFSIAGLSFAGLALVSLMMFRYTPW